jgi:deoxyribose-phosphate aldolase
MKLTAENLARMVDLSAVRTDVSLAEVHELAATAGRYRCICAFVLPCYVAELAELLAGAAGDVHVGGTVGFPSGAHATPVKAAEARQLLADGADELDMVINVGLLISGRLAAVEEDIRAVVGAAGGKPVKVILECHYLNDDQIRRGAELAALGGAAFVKTATGWAPTGATAHNVALIRSAIGEVAGVKAAGGIRSLETLVELYRAGARRFGLGAASGVKILDQCAALPGGAVEV